MLMVWEGVQCTHQVKSLGCSSPLGPLGVMMRRKRHANMTLIFVSCAFRHGRCELHLHDARGFGVRHNSRPGAGNCCRAKVGHTSLGARKQPLFVSLPPAWGLCCAKPDEKPCSLPHSHRRFFFSFLPAFYLVAHCVMVLLRRASRQHGQNYPSLLQPEERE